MKPASPRPQAGQSKPEPRSVTNENRTSGAAIARRLTASAAASASARSDLRNLSRAGVTANRSRASTRAPVAQPQGSIALLIPSSTRSLSPCGAPGAAGAELEPRHRGDRGQGFAAEAKGGDLHEIAVGNLRRCVPFDGKGEIGCVQPVPVVDDPDQLPAAGLDRDCYRFRAGVERVLDQFLDRRRRPLDHLARGDAVDGQEDRDGELAWDFGPRRTLSH